MKNTTDIGQITPELLAEMKELLHTFQKKMLAMRKEAFKAEWDAANNEIGLSWVALQGTPDLIAIQKVLDGQELRDGEGCLDSPAARRWFVALQTRDAIKAKMLAPLVLEFNEEHEDENE
jgi:hypothetical protein